MSGNILSNTMFQLYIFILGLGIILGGMIYFMDYKKIGKYSLLLYSIGIILNIVSSISCDARTEYLYATLPFYVISFAGFINTTNKNKGKIFKTIVLSIVSLILLSKTSGVALRFVAFTYLIMSTIKILKSNKNRVKYLAIIWIIPLIIGGMDAYARICDMRMNSENQWMGLVNRKKGINQFSRIIWNS